jgi:hypothetical protein
MLMTDIMFIIYFYIITKHRKSKIKKKNNTNKISIKRISRVCDKDKYNISQKFKG